MKVIFTVGLPASGKSTWAKEYVEHNPGAVRVNKDSLRNMLFNGVYTTDNENFVKGVLQDTVLKALSQKRDVIIDDTNLNPEHIQHISKCCKHMYHKNVDLFVNDSFLHIPLEDLIERDSEREDSVGKEVIMNMREKYLQEITTPNFYKDLLFEV